MEWYICHSWINFIHTWKHDKLKFTKSRCSNTKKIGEFDKYATKAKSSKEKNKKSFSYSHSKLAFIVDTNLKSWKYWLNGAFVV
jgi:hypothetical protein